LASLETITRNAETVQGFQIQAPADMMTALTYLAPGGGITGTGYTGTINQTSTGTSASVAWTLLINNTSTNTSAFASIGDWIILENNTLASVCKEANFSTLYTA
jgi:hypothetical protein